jgi:methyl-accepting chemotaxis protein
MYRKTFLKLEAGIQIFNMNMRQMLDYVFMKSDNLSASTYKYDDAMGIVLAHFEDFKQLLIKNRNEDLKVLGEIVLVLNKVQYGIYSCQVKATSDNIMIREICKTLNQSVLHIKNNMESTKNILSQYANHQFKNQIEINSYMKSNLLDVVQGVNYLGEYLAFNVTRDEENATTLQKNISEIFLLINQLSTKANQQAASLEETAASLEEITSITRNNTSNTIKMAELGNLVNNAVSLGHNLANQTASSMDEINHEVLAINEAIKVIDQISFQTNILSLNAAVEAATAGEAGKGFAVVAGEVRNLASRSADAAKEIKELVESATSKAHNGKNISTRMIQGYQTLNTHITQTLHLIDDVNNASKEQMEGIEQINNAVAILDRVTQENASDTNNINNIIANVEKMAVELVQSHKKGK